MKIIALDDESGALKLLSRAILNAEPACELTCFQEVRESLAYAEGHEIDVAFLDIQMPEMSGIDVAKRIKKYHPKVNIIFTTGFSEYAIDALKLRSSGYLLKPVTKSDVKSELENLRHPVDKKEKKERGIVIRTFGSFDVFVNGELLVFRRERAKEVLAYLVDRNGFAVTRKEIAAVVFEDKEYSRATQAYLTQIIGYLNEFLKEKGAEHLLIKDYNTYAINKEECTCDAFDYFDGKPDAINNFHGEYMKQYYWAEEQYYRFYE